MIIETANLKSCDVLHLLAMLSATGEYQHHPTGRHNLFFFPVHNKELKHLWNASAFSTADIAILLGSSCFYYCYYWFCLDLLRKYFIFNPDGYSSIP